MPTFLEHLFYIFFHVGCWSKVKNDEAWSNDIGQVVVRALYYYQFPNMYIYCDNLPSFCLAACLLHNNVCALDWQFQTKKQLLKFIRLPSLTVTSWCMHKVSIKLFNIYECYNIPLTWKNLWKKSFIPLAILMLAYVNNHTQIMYVIRRCCYVCIFIYSVSATLV